jgi:hypothetical protein
LSAAGLAARLSVTGAPQAPSPMRPRRATADGAVQRTAALERSLSGDPERFVALNGILVAEDDAAPSQFSEVWLDNCLSADDQLN